MACDICGKTFPDRISVDIHRVKHIEEELYPCDMCEATDGPDGEHEPHLAVYFRIKFFTDDNQHILEDQKKEKEMLEASVNQTGICSRQSGPWVTHNYLQVYSTVYKKSVLIGIPISFFFWRET